MELDRVKKNLPSSAEAKRLLVESKHPGLSVVRQCESLGLPRSRYSYELAAAPKEDLRLLRLSDEQYPRQPVFGSRRLAAWLREDCREQVNRKRVQRLRRVLGLEAIYPKPRLSAGGRNHKVYPYWLRGVAIPRPDQVGSTDSTSVPRPQGFLYLAAVRDWYSRYVVAWRLSNTLDGESCLERLAEALGQGRPEVFTTDQGVPFTADAWTGRLLAAGVPVSRDGKGRCLDNVWVERLGRTVKHEELYRKRYETVPLLQAGLKAYFPFSNEERRHQSLGYRVPGQVYREGRARAAG
jgi:putative transposase